MGKTVTLLSGDAGNRATHVKHSSSTFHSDSSEILPTPKVTSSVIFLREEYNLVDCSLGKPDLELDQLQEGTSSGDRFTVVLTA